MDGVKKGKKKTKVTNKLELKSNYVVKQCMGPFYTGGNVEISHDGKYMFCTCGEKIQILDVETGVSEIVLNHEEGEISCFTLSPDDTKVVTATKSLLLKQWEWKEATCVRTWKALHIAPVISMDFDATSTLLATGGSDGTIKVWDVINQYCTHNFKGSPGIINILRFHPTNLTLYSSSDDYNIRVWDLQTSRCISILESHCSAVTSLKFPSDTCLISSGRDNVVCIWDIPDGSPPAHISPQKVIPVLENVEDILVLPMDSTFPELSIKKVENGNEFYFLTAGNKGMLRIWNSLTGRRVFNKESEATRDSSQEYGGYIHVRKVASTGCILCVTNDHHFDFVKLDGLQVQKHMVGFNDDILDIKLLGQESHILVITNSPNIKIFDISSSSCQVLKGHTNTVLCVHVFSDKLTFTSSSKDNSIRLWEFDPTLSIARCLKKLEGHTHAVSCVAACNIGIDFFASGSEDLTLKIWEIKKSKKEQIDIHVRYTLLAHEKNINTVTISPNDKLIATGSQDKLAKLWSVEDGKHVGTFRGHRRGIWCAQFSPMDRILATSSADGTIKLWSLSDFSCLKTLEGHDASVLKVIFIVRGTQIITAGSDGLLKLWTVKTSECVQTLDHHTDKIWAVCTNSDDSILFSGSADSIIVTWEDVTEKMRLENAEAGEKVLLHHQELQNLLHEKRYTKALLLAIRLEQPFTALTVVKEILWEDSGQQELKFTIANLRLDQKQSLLKFIVCWNCNSRNCHEAQAVLHALFLCTSPEEIQKFPNSHSTIEALLPYTTRHFQRISRIAQQATFLDYTWAIMKMIPQESDE